MELLNTNYIEQLSHKSDTLINGEGNHYYTTNNKFEKINAALVEKICCADNQNLHIQLQDKEDKNSLILPTLILPILRAFKKNFTYENKIAIKGDRLLSIKTHEEFLIIQIQDTKYTIDKICSKNGYKKEINSLSNYIILPPNIKVGNIQGRYEEYQTFFAAYIPEGNIVPIRHRNKVIVVGNQNFKNSFLEFKHIPFAFINTEGEIESYHPIDPIVLLCNSYQTVRQHIINKNLCSIEAIIFIGDTKYKYATNAISQGYRLNFNSCIFIGTEEVKNFPDTLKWSWQLPEMYFFNYQKLLNDNHIKVEHIPNQELSESIIEYYNTIKNIENQHTISFKHSKLFTYIRRLQTIANINSVDFYKNISDINAQFCEYCKDLLQTELSSIGASYEDHYTEVINAFNKIIISLNGKGKSDWLKQKIRDIDFLVVPSYHKLFWEKEIKILNRQPVKKVNDFRGLQNILGQQPENKINTEIITIKEFSKREFSKNAKIVFLSTYGYGYYTDQFYELLLSAGNIATVLLYEDESKTFSYYKTKYYNDLLSQYHSPDRLMLLDVKYPDPTIEEENIDDLILRLALAEKPSASEVDEYEITFNNNTKLIERATRSVLLKEGGKWKLELIKNLKSADRVSIYQNINKDIFHTIVELYDEELFNKVNTFSALWKKALKEYFDQKCYDDFLEYGINELMNELRNNGLQLKTTSTLEKWLSTEHKDKFPNRRINLLAIIKTVNHPELTNKKDEIRPLISKYRGRLVEAGNDFSEQINNYIIDPENKGELLQLLNEEEFRKIVNQNAPERIIKEITLIDNTNEDDEH
jgi:hypothetical protein